MLKWALILSAGYLAAIGVGVIFFPLKFGIGAVPPDASSELLALLRLLGGPLLGIATLNLLARKLAPGAALRAIVLANIVGFGAVALNDVHGVATGEAREAARLFLVVHAAFTAAFVVALLRMRL